MKRRTALPAARAASAEKHAHSSRVAPLVSGSGRQVMVYITTRVQFRKKR